MGKVTLLSSDGVKFPGVDPETAIGSKTLKTMFENLGVSDGDTEEVIPVLNVSGDNLKLVLDWEKRQQGCGAASSQQAKAEMKDYFDTMEKEALFALTRAANYLDIDVLLDQCTSAVARRLEGKSCDEIRNLFKPSE